MLSQQLKFHYILWLPKRIYKIPWLSPFGIHLSNFHTIPDISGPGTVQILPVTECPSHRSCQVCWLCWWVLHCGLAPRPGRAVRTPGCERQIRWPLTLASPLPVAIRQGCRGRARSRSARRWPGPSSPSEHRKDFHSGPSGTSPLLALQGTQSWVTQCL